MKFCFKGNITGALLGKTEGGGELQVALLAKALAKNGHEVVIIDPVDCDRDFITEDGIKVLTVPNWKNGLPVIRFMFKLLPGLYHLLLQQKADVYYCRMRDFQHLLPYLVARKVNAKFVLAMAADIDATGFKERYQYFYKTQKFSLWLFFSGLLIEIVQPFLLRKSDIVLSQHEGQKQILDDRKIKSFVFGNLIDLAIIPVVDNPVKADFIYVSSFLQIRKGFIELFRLIEQSPMHSFTIIGKPSGKVSIDLFEKLKTFKNVKLLGKLDHLESIIHIANSKALVTTSPMEGFPNIFLEAWATGVPVISFIVDPGGIIVKNHLGLVCDGQFDLLWSNINNFDKCIFDGNKLKDYVKKNHSVEFAHSKLLDILNT